MNFLNKITAPLQGPGHSETPTWQAKLSYSAVLLGMLIMATHSTVSLAAVNSTIGGEVERIIVDDPTDTWSGGTIVVGGVNVIIPRNMVIDLPANRLTLQQFFVNAPSACTDGPDADTVPDETGLAKADSCNGSFTGAAITMLANRTNNGDIIAGEIMLEKATELVSGTVSFVNYDEGYFRVDGVTTAPDNATTGAMVRVNDPEGRHTHQTGAGCAGSGPNCSADTRYGVDPDNYTFTASTGYPMCIPSTVSRGPFDFDVTRDGDTLDTDESNLTAVAALDGTGDLLCPQTNRPGAGIVADSRLFAPVKIGDHVNAEGNFETIGGVTFLSAHTVGVSVGLTTDNDPFQPDYMVFDEVGWDIPGFQNQRVRDLLIGFSTLGSPAVDIFGLYYDPATNSVEELVIATTVGCDIVAGPGSCTTQGIVGNTSIFKVVHDVDFVEASLGALPKAIRSPCQHLNAAYANGGIPDVNGTFIMADPKDRCQGGLTIAKEFEVLSPPTRDIIGRSRHKHFLDTSVITLDFHGIASQNGEYLNPVGIGHPEFVEIDLNALQTPLIFAGTPWALDRRLGPGGGCDGELSCDTLTAIGDQSMSLDPFPYSDLDPGTQAGPPSPGGTGVPIVSGYGVQRGRPLSYWPFATTAGAKLIMPWPPADPVAQGIVPTLHAGLMCGLDTDGDGVFDDIDNCPVTANPGQENNDPDTFGNVCDNCTLVANADQRDTDADGYGNICDADLNGDITVDLGDFSQFRSVFGSTAPGVVPFVLEDHADLNGDGSVDLGDFSIFRSLFGGAPGPSGLNP